MWQKYLIRDVYGIFLSLKNKNNLAYCSYKSHFVCLCSTKLREKKQQKHNHYDNQLDSDPSGREIARPIRGLTIIREQHADGTINIRKISTE